jgi:hypothetical protein
MDFHGSRAGLRLSSDEEIEWNALKAMLTKINVSCRNNLLITLSACRGVYLITIVKPTEPTPFWGLIGPVGDTSQGDVDLKFKSFYEGLFQTFSGDIALEHIIVPNAIKPTYAFVHCINLYRDAYTNYHQRFCRGKSLKSRTESLVTKIRSTPIGKSMPIKEFRKKIKFELRDERKAFQKYRKIFFMIDLYPENDKRFPLRFEDVVNQKS